MMIDHARPAGRLQAGVQPDALQVGPQLVDRRVAALRVGGQRRQLALRGSTASRRSWSLRALRLATSTVRSCDDSPANAVPARLRPELDDDEQPEHEGHGRDRQLVPPSVHASRPGSPRPVTAAPSADGRRPGAGVAQGDRPGEGRHVDRLRLGELRRRMP